MSDSDKRQDDVNIKPELSSKLIKPIPTRNNIPLQNSMMNGMSPQTLGVGTEFTNAYSNPMSIQMPTNSCTLNAILQFLSNQTLQTQAQGI